MDEFDLISRLNEQTVPPEGTRLGIGDDAAVLDEGRFDLLTTDVLVEDVHFRRDWCSDEAIGWRALAASLSDIAAMGGHPGPYVLSIGIGDGLDDPHVESMVQGMRRVSEAVVPEGAELGLVGGDTTSTSGPSFLSIALLGRAAGDEPVWRSGAEVDDRLVLTGCPGRSAAGLELLQGALAPDPETHDGLVEAYCRPRPRVRTGSWLGHRGIPSAMIDVSDGLAADLGHVIEASEVGARVEVDAIPRAPRVEHVAAASDRESIPWLLGGGEDFELLMTVPPDRMDEIHRRAEAEDWPISKIGVILPSDEGVEYRSQGRTLELETEGYEHTWTD